MYKCFKCSNELEQGGGESEGEVYLAPCKTCLATVTLSVISSTNDALVEIRDELIDLFESEGIPYAG